MRQSDTLLAWALAADLPSTRQIGPHAVGRVLAALTLYADAQGIAWPSAQTLAGDVSGLSRRDVRNALDALAAAGLIAVAEAAPGRVTRWRLCAPHLAGYPATPTDVAGYPATPTSEDLAGSPATHLAGDLAGDLAGYPATHLAGDLAGDLAGYPATKEKENNNMHAWDAEPETTTALAAAPAPPSRADELAAVILAQPAAATLDGAGRVAAEHAATLDGAGWEPDALAAVLDRRRRELDRAVNPAAYLRSVLRGFVADGPPRPTTRTTTGASMLCPHHGVHYLDTAVCAPCRGDFKAGQRAPEDVSGHLSADDLQWHRERELVSEVA
ncbi:helix-turn-helix domain-containing protein [Georgenia sp. M64]|uniref:helix-turn-helix domain-containing protein n=1 Tax=Georgenia sp. M64 TaxID=3120520 RepID=UPI0030E11880